MGLLKKIFKPVSKVLDKIVPNEVKPFLPYAAAFAPFIAPGIMGTSVMQRALMGGGLNIFGQLAQEGNEGDINLLSAGLGALSGAMTAPGSAGGRAIGDTGASYSQYMGGDKLASAGSQNATNFFKGISDSAQGSGVMASGQRFLGDTLAKGSDIMSAGLKEGLFSKAGLKAAALPAATATGDLMFAQAKRDQDEYDRMMEEESESEYASDASRALAIRQSMESYGFTEEEILAAIEAAGYKAGGRVGLEFGGMPGALAATALKEEDKSKYITKKDDIEIMNRIFTEGGHEGLNAYIEKNPELTDKYVNIMVNQDDEVIAIPNQLYDMENMLEIQGGDGSGIILLNNEMFENKAKGGRVGAEEGGAVGIMNAKRGFVDGPGGYAGEIAPPLNNKIEGFNQKMVDEYLQGNYPEYEGEKVSDFYNRPNFTDVNAVIKIIEMGGDFDDVRETLKIDISDERIKDFIKFDQEKKEKKSSENFYMKDGGLMNLGGKEMDMRGGGFIPIGKKERADDVPARLSKNEFVMTADAVRAAGGGSVNKGAKRMYDVMNKLEARA